MAGGFGRGDAYLRWRLAGKTQHGAHSEKELGMPALDYYQEEAVVKLIEGDWKWQERFTLGKQLEKIAADLVTEHTGWEMKVYRLMEKLMRRVRRLRVRGEGFMVNDDDVEGKKRMKLLDKIYMFEAERKSAEENYKAFGATREEHQKKMLEFVFKELEAKKTEMRIHG